jgi:hypothetical protein
MQRLFLLPLCCAFLMGCGAIPGVQRSSRLVATDSKDGIVYTLRIPTDSLSVRDTLRGEFEVWNRSGETRTFRFGCMEQLGCDLLDSNGHEALKYPDLFKPAWSDFTLGDSEKKVLRFRLVFKRLYREYLSPGVYTLRAYLLTEEEERVPMELRLTLR